MTRDQWVVFQGFPGIRHGAWNLRWYLYPSLPLFVLLWILNSLIRRLLGILSELTEAINTGVYYNLFSSSSEDRCHLTVMSCAMSSASGTCIGLPPFNEGTSPIMRDLRCFRAVKLIVKIASIFPASTAGSGVPILLSACGQQQSAYEHWQGHHPLVVSDPPDYVN